MHKVGSVLLSSLVLVAAACGKVQTFTDAGNGDIDGGQDALASGTVTVTTYARSGGAVASGEPISGIDVVVVGPDGSVRDSGLTDGSGEVILDIVAGDSVTAVYRGVSGGELVTYVAAKPGDHLQFGEQFVTGGTQTATMTMNWPLTVANYFEVYYPCGTGYGSTGTTSTTLTEYSDCALSPFDALFIAWDLNNPQFIAQWGLLENLPFSNGTSATLNTWQAPSNFTLGASDLGDEVNYTRLQALPLLNGRTGPNVSLEGVPSGGTLQANRPWATGGDGIFVSAELGRTGGFGPQLTAERLPANATQWNAADPARLPWFGPIVSNAAARQISWITDGDGGHDTTMLFMSWSHYGTDGGFFSYQWTFFVPPGLDELRFPELPSTLMPYLPEDDDSPYVFGFMVDYAADASYDAFRARPEWAVGLFGGLPAEQLWISVSPNFDRIPPTERPPMPLLDTPGPVLAP